MIKVYRVFSCNSFSMEEDNRYFINKDNAKEYMKNLVNDFIKTTADGEIIEKEEEFIKVSFTSRLGDDYEEDFMNFIFKKIKIEDNKTSYNINFTKKEEK